MIEPKLKRLRKLLYQVELLRAEIFAEIREEEVEQTHHHRHTPVVTSLNLRVAECHKHQWRRFGLALYACDKCGVSGRLS